MKEEKFSIADALSFGWNQTTEKWRFFVPIGAIFMVLSFGGYADSFINGSDSNSFGMISFLLSILSAILSVGVINIALKTVDDKESTFNDLFPKFSILVKYIITAIILGIIVLVGFCLLIVPGIIWAIKYSQFGYFVIEKNANPFEALNMSSKITAGQKGNLFIFGLVIAIVNLAGLIAFGLGYLITYPVTFLASAYVFRQLSDAHKKELKAAEKSEDKSEDKIQEKPTEA